MATVVSRARLSVTLYVHCLSSLVWSMNCVKMCTISGSWNSWIIFMVINVWPLYDNTRWFKYDRDYLCVNKSQFVPVIFEPPCISVLLRIDRQILNDQKKSVMRNLIIYGLVLCSIPLRRWLGANSFIAASLSLCWTSRLGSLARVLIGWLS